MENYEVLSPVGDLKTFYTAIKSGANAVYLGLPKFNARMRAENINLDNLEEVVNFAHLKGVKCYITLNTILTNKEILEAIELVGNCLKYGVDAFIVQDLGLATALKTTFPNIVLHGSTQMGVHNARGARVLKNLGFSRVVLSRECTIEDIRDIRNNVDIELEVFVQGAMCVGFSGNCYLSSIKCSASGNRGECKQLCRLPYILSDNKKSLKGYALSIRDNCMLEHISTLMDIGVQSFKIEGRLRHDGYVAVATSTYRNAVDSILSAVNVNYKSLKEGLYKTFARGEFIDSYNSSNNVIDSTINNHIGLPIGEVVSCTKFKDLYKIALKTKTQLHSGDGLKFIDNEIISMGVGNVESDGKNQIVFGKNYIKNGTKVYLSLDSEFEKSISDYSYRRVIDIDFEGFVGNLSRLLLRSGEFVAEIFGDICEPAKNKAIDKDTILKQITKWDNDIWELGETSISLEDIYLPLSKINEMRRQGLLLLEDKILSSYKKPVNEKPLDINFIKPQMPYDNIILVDENFKDYKSLLNFGAIILSPTEYSINTIKTFVNKIKSKFDGDIFLNLPIIARVNDLHIIDDIVDKFKNSIKFVANNIYAIDYINNGAEVFAGSNLNIINNFSMNAYLDLGVVGIIGSIEKSFPRLLGTYKYSGKSTLMTFTHCPYKTLYNNDCSSCLNNNSLTLSGDRVYKIRRYKIASCYFELIDNINLSSAGENLIIDVR